MSATAESRHVTIQIVFYFCTETSELVTRMGETSLRLLLYIVGIKTAGLRRLGERSFP